MIQTKPNSQLTDEERLEICGYVVNRMIAKETTKILMAKLGMDYNDLLQTMYVVCWTLKSQIDKSSYKLSTILKRRIFDELRKLSKGWMRWTKKTCKGPISSGIEVGPDIDEKTAKLLPVHESKDLVGVELAMIGDKLPKKEKETFHYIIKGFTSKEISKLRSTAIKTEHKNIRKLREHIRANILSDTE